MQLIRVYCGSWLLCLVAITSLVLLLSLGTWQLGRAVEKEELLADQKSKSEQSVVVLSTLLNDGRPIDDYRYRDVQVSGKYDSSHQFLLDNQVKNRRVGYNVITPLYTEAGEIVLVDRGWVPMGLSRQLTPNVALDDEALMRVVEGSLYTPLGEAYSLGAMDDGEITWPRVIQFLDFEAMSNRVGGDVLPLVVRLSPAMDDGFLREWPIVAAGPEKHLGYAFQWFMMAFVLATLLIVLSRRRLNNDDNTGG